MPNNLYNQMNNGNIIQQFNQFRRMMNGDPKQEVMKLMQSGRLTQNQLNAIQNNPIAQMLHNMMR